MPLVDLEALHAGREALTAMPESRLEESLEKLVLSFRKGIWSTMATQALLGVWPDVHAQEAVQRAFRPFSRTAITRMLRLGRQARAETSGEKARTPYFLAAVLAGPIPALAVNVVFWSLAARTPVVLLPSRRYPDFATLFSHAANGALPSVRGVVQAMIGAKESGPVAEVLRTAPVVVAYGADTTFQRILQARSGKPTLGGGHSESIVVLASNLGRRRLARLARVVAREVAIYDQRGCLSPHVVLCSLPEGDSLYFSRRLFEELGKLEKTLPRGPMGLELSAAVRAFFEESMILSRQGKAVVFAPEGGMAPAVVYSGEAEYRPGPGGRIVQVLDLPERFSDRIPTLASRLQAIGFAGPREFLDSLLEAEPEFKPCLITTPGRLQSPKAVWPENGVILTRELARLADKRAGNC